MTDTDKLDEIYTAIVETLDSKFPKESLPTIACVVAAMASDMHYDMKITKETFLEIMGNSYELSDAEAQETH